MSENKPLIQFQNVQIGYSQKKPVLSGLNFVLEPGSFTGIIGPNGSGKTTLLKTILGLIRPLSGEVLLACETLRFGYVQQRQQIDDIFPLTVKEVVMMGRFGIIGLLKRPRADDFAEVEKALSRVKISKLADRSYRDLSGGQKQRVLIARALASNPNMLVLDEPTNDLDINGEYQVMNLLKELNEKEGLSVVVVSHLLNVVLNYARQIGFTAEDHFHLASTEKAVKEDHLSKIYKVPVKVESVNGKKSVWVVQR